ncbi:MAG: pantoate--beta-alanine ligase [Candidatus Eremiobacteraeota bacterium]|nr:pantoate--beta-alanine ligase [Candidatus Eremiobacteraeota bacterium]
MQVATTILQARALFDVLPRPLGFVPTMGALHEGHLALVRRAREESTTVGASIFINPLQFGANEDLEKYPRDIEADRAKFSAAGVDVLFLPNQAVMYPPDFSTAVDAGEMGTRFEGAARPTHFRGVTTVVSKLLNIVRPDTLYLGQKDAQQTAVLRRMIRDLDIPTHVTIVPTEREADGLALSSRNVYLSVEERQAAPSLHHALQALRMAMQMGKSKADAVAAARTRLDPLAQLDYLDVVDANTFAPIDVLSPPAFVIGAARFGSTRLLDNLWIE